MLGLMQDWPLLISKILNHAERHHGRREVVTMTVEGPIHRYTYADMAARSRKLAQALQRLGIGVGDRVGSIAWNTYRHVELWFATSGSGAVMHTVNPRLFPEQIAYIVNHAEDRVLFVDLTFVPLVEKMIDHFQGVDAFVIMTDEAHMPETSLTNALCYETLVAAEDGAYSWPRLDENTAAGLCYTSGTTGNPKGVLYSHRSTVLHCFATLCTDTLAIRATDATLPIVPMFHANAWGVPYAAAAAGAKLALNGPNHEPEPLHALIEDEGVTVTAAVPTIWLGMLDYLGKTGKRLDCLQRVTIGGAAAPRTMIEMFQKVYGVQVSHAWGMTELNPLGTVGSPNAYSAALDEDGQLDLKCKQGRAVFGVEMKIVDDDDVELPWDGVAFGRLKVRGPWVAGEYFKHEGGAILDDAGWFDTGDVSTIDEHGFMQITDRSKDVIKSGGEWISSIDLENAAVGHPDVAEAAVIGIHHPKWDERPLLIVVPQDGRTVDKQVMTEFLTGKVAKWWLPDDVVTVSEIPHTATGKIQKTTLREQFKDYKLPTY